MCSVFMFHTAAMQTHQGMSGGSWMRHVWPLDQQWGRGGVGGVGGGAVGGRGKGRGRRGGAHIQALLGCPGRDPFPFSNHRWGGWGWRVGSSFHLLYLGIKPFIEAPISIRPPTERRTGRRSHMSPRCLSLGDYVPLFWGICSSSCLHLCAAPVWKHHWFSSQWLEPAP